LPSSKASWPRIPVMTKENPVNPDPLYPKNLGYQFLGYSYDSDFSPSFSYRIGKVKIEDTSTPSEKDGKVTLARVLKLQSDEPRSMHFRALVGKIEKVSESAYQTPDLRIELGDVGGANGFLRSLGPEEGVFELLLKLDLPKGKSQLNLNYDPLR